MSLDLWLRNGWLQQDEATVAEIQQLLQVVDRDLADAQVVGLSADGRFQHAYDAALQLCMLALRATGYRVRKGQGHHKHGIDSLRYTLGEKWSEPQTTSNDARACVVKLFTSVLASSADKMRMTCCRPRRSYVLTWLIGSKPLMPHWFRRTPNPFRRILT